MCLNDFSVTKLERNSLINKTFGTSIKSTFKVFDFNVEENLGSLSVSAKHDAYKDNFNYIHERKMTINKKNGNLSGEDNLISENTSIQTTNTYNIRFHLYPGVNAVRTIGKSSVLIQIEKNKSLIFTAMGENIYLEKSIFLGRNQIINNSCISVSGTLKNNESKKILWNLKRNN